MEKAVILAGGRGTRLAEETTMRPKPMVEIGGRPILWHIMNIYAQFGVREFYVACGYMGEYIKEYFHNFSLHNSDFSIRLRDGNKQVINQKAPDWTVHLIDTGINTMTGGRLLRLKPYLKEEQFMLTYGDGVANIDIEKLLELHKTRGTTATITAVRPPSRFGGLVIEDDQVHEFSEKPQTGEGWINGGFFVFEPGIFDHLENDESVLERFPMETLAKERQLTVYKHHGFWQPMDTLREKNLLQSLWDSGDPPWMRNP